MLKPFELILNELQADRKLHGKTAHPSYQGLRNGNLETVLERRFVGDAETMGIFEYIKNSPFYKNKLKGVPQPQSLENLMDLPFTTASEIATLENPMHLISKPTLKGLKVIRTSGTTGGAKYYYYTSHDDQLAGEVAYRVARWMGAKQQWNSVNLMIRGPYVSGEIIDTVAQIFGGNLFSHGIHHAKEAFEDMIKHKRIDLVASFPVAFLLMQKRIVKKAIEEIGNRKIDATLEEYASKLGIGRFFRTSLGKKLLEFFGKRKLARLKNQVVTDPEFSDKVFALVRERYELELGVALVGGDLLTSLAYERIKTMGFKEVYNVYAASEWNGAPFGYCTGTAPMDVPMDAFIAELRTEDGSTKPLWKCRKGETGSLIITTAMEGTPLLRFDMEDLIRYEGNGKITVLGRASDSGMWGSAKVPRAPLERAMEKTINTSPVFWDVVEVNEGGFVRPIFRISARHKRMPPDKVKKELLHNIQSVAMGGLEELIRALENAFVLEPKVIYLDASRFPGNPHKFKRFKTYLRKPKVDPYEVKV